MRVASAVPPTRQLTLLRWYYAATPAFWALDAFGVSLRAAFLDSMPLGRQLYYALCCAIGIATFIVPRHAGRLALIESTVNLCFLILSVGVWYLGVIDWALEATPQVAVPGPGHVANFVIVAAAAAVSYERQRWSG